MAMATSSARIPVASSAGAAAAVPRSPTKTQFHFHSTTSHKQILPTPSHKKSSPFLNLSKAVAATALTLTLISSNPIPDQFSVAAAAEAAEYSKYYGTAGSAANYGGYGGNASKQESAEYSYDVPAGWKERLVSKIQKGTNGTDSEFYNPKRKEEKEYLTSLSGFGSLAPKDTVLNDLALSDVSLQDMISTADNISSAERRREDGQLYYDFEIDSPIAHGLISVTCAKNKLYAHFVKAPAKAWERDEAMLRHVHDSFVTLGSSDNL